MSVDKMITAISNRALGRFSVSEGAEDLFPLDQPIPNAHVCRLQRVGSSVGWRTILVAHMQYSSESVQTAYRWAADVRDQLSEAETADLYMFMLMDEIPDEEAARIETDDKFCRKVVMRSWESAHDLLDRTFLAGLSPNGVTSPIGDPLQTALASLANEHPWTQGYLGIWRDILLSGKTGSDLANALTSVQNNDETAQ